MYVDPSGYFVVFNLNGFQKRVKMILGLIEDVSNFNISNDDEGIVLDSNYFSFYKGNLVIRHSLPGSSCALFDIIVLNKNENRTSAVKHEWGHTQQYKMMGTVNYILYIGIPSFIGYITDVPRYFSQPWEHSADVLGGVYRQSGQYDMTDEEAMNYVYRHSRDHLIPLPIPQPFLWP